MLDGRHGPDYYEPHRAWIPAWSTPGYVHLQAASRLRPILRSEVVKFRASNRLADRSPSGHVDRSVRAECRSSVSIELLKKTAHCERHSYPSKSDRNSYCAPFRSAYREGCTFSQFWAWKRWI